MILLHIGTYCCASSDMCCTTPACALQQPKTVNTLLPQDSPSTDRSHRPPAFSSPLLQADLGDCGQWGHPAAAIHRGFTAVQCQQQLWHLCCTCDTARHCAQGTRRPGWQLLKEPAEPSMMQPKRSASSFHAARLPHTVNIPPAGQYAVCTCMQRFRAGGRRLNKVRLLPANHTSHGWTYATTTG